MRAQTAITAALSLALLSTEVAATLPACMLACVEKVGRESSQCTSMNQIPCFCTNEVAAMRECFDAICPNNNADAAYAAFESACSDMNVRLDAEPSSSSASSSASSSSSSIASSSPSSSSMATTSSEEEESRSTFTSSAMAESTSSSSSSSSREPEVREETVSDSTSIHYEHTLEAYTGAANVHFVQYVHQWVGAAVAALFI